MAQVLRPLHGNPALEHPDLVVGIESGDDAGVLRLRDDLALVQSVDYFTPIVDDPSDWGRIAAANALSDIYAMGAFPLSALQIVGWPRDVLPLRLLTAVLEGAAEVLAGAGCVIVGGHSLDDPEPKFGLSVTGTVHPDHVVTNAAARPGDALVLTKPLGTGIVSTAIKRDRADAATVAAAVASMVALNDEARDAMLEAGASAATDITGFGLVGHLGEMTSASKVGADVDWKAVPLLPGVRPLVELGSVPGGTKRNLAHAEGFTDFGKVDSVARTLLADAQTSGGLLIAAAPEAADAIVARIGPPAAVVGRVRDGSGIRVV